MRRLADAILAFVRSEISRDEIELVLALGLIATGFWMFWKPGSCLVPGFVLLWHVLPARAPFVGGRDQSTESTERRN